MRRPYVIVLIVLLFLFARSAHAEVVIELSPGVGYLDGDNTYSIGDEARKPLWEPVQLDPISELEFPLGVWFATLDAKLTCGNVALSGRIGHNLTDNAGDMKDSDWGYPYQVDGTTYVDVWTDGYRQWHALDVLSYSRSEVEALILDAKVSYLMYSSRRPCRIENVTGEAARSRGFDLEVWLGVGYEWRKFEYECALIRQWSPSGIPVREYVGDGSIGLTYDVSYSIPYAELSVAGGTERLDLAFSIGYSPFVQARDEDRHLARNPPIYAKGDCTGKALKGGAAVGYFLTQRWGLICAFDYIMIDTDGHQHNRMAGELPWTSYEEITARQSLFTAGLVYRFGVRSWSGKNH